MPPQEGIFHFWLLSLSSCGLLKSYTLLEYLARRVVNSSTKNGINHALIALRVDAYYLVTFSSFMTNNTISAKGEQR